MSDPIDPAPAPRPRTDKTTEAPTAPAAPAAGAAQLRLPYPGDRLVLTDGTEITGQWADYPADQADTIQDAAKAAGVTLLRK